MIWILIAVLITGIDQLTKYLVINNLDYGVSNQIIDGFFYFTFINNKGAAFGMFQNAMIIFIPLTILVGGIIIYMIFKSKDKLLNIALSFVLGGAVGNLIDRMFRSDGVVDFLDFRFGSFSFWIFNVADSFVVIGTILLAVYILFFHKEEKVNTNE
jgi:signal peptidase II